MQAKYRYWNDLGGPPGGWVEFADDERCLKRLDLDFRVQRRGPDRTWVDLPRGWKPAKRRRR